MISPQAKLVRGILRVTSGVKGYDASRISQHRASFERNLTLLFPTVRTKLKRTHIAGVSVAWILLPELTDRTIVYLHGGGFVFGSVKTHQQHMGRLGRMCKANILAIDYGLSPENPYPTALEQIQKVWEEVTKQGLDVSKTVIMGDSAGGGLALSSALRFREANLLQPACLVLLSPALDATFSGSSYVRKDIQDPMLNMRKAAFFADNYARHYAKDIPFISPVYADLKGLPPMLIHVGSEELLLSDSQTIAQNAKRDGVNATLFVGEGMWHGWHFFASYVPEAKRAMKAVATYIATHTPSS